MWFSLNIRDQSNTRNADTYGKHTYGTNNNNNHINYFKALTR
jgi:hypothetical protein